MLQTAKSYFYRIVKQKPWKKLFPKFETKTKVCRLCFKNINELSFHYLGHANLTICQKCQDQFHTLFETTNLHGTKVLTLYEYNEFMRENLYKLKACGDVEISSGFLSYHLPYLRARFRNYLVIPAPSHREHDEKRGFNHVEEIFKSVGKKMCKAIIKTQNRKQSDLSALERSRISEILQWDKTVDIEHEKILLVDDVMTTGSTIEACLSLIKQHAPKSIVVLVLSKVVNYRER